MSEGVERRLAAIVIADVVGYSKLVREDEEGTRARFRHLRDNVFQPHIASQGGRLVKTMGDAFLLEFPSAVAALRCLIKIRQDLPAAAEDIEPAKQLRFRTGVNVGDVVVEEDDLHGDGVNIAARLEKLAKPGEILVSQAVYDQVRRQIDTGFEDLGEQTLKNIDETVRVYRLLSDGQTSTELIGPSHRSTPKAQSALNEIGEQTPIAVLPFDNMSQDPELSHFADGLAEDLITALSYYKTNLVISRNSAFAYRGSNKDIREIAQKLGVRYVFEGSVRKVGKRLRTTVQLIEAEQGGHLWAQRFDRPMEDIFEDLDEVVAAIVTPIVPVLRVAEIKHRRRNGGDALSATDYWYLANAALSDLNQGTFTTAEQHLQKAIEIEPKFSNAYANYAQLISYGLYLYLDLDVEKRMAQTNDLAEQAVRFDNNNYYGHVALGNAKILRGDHQAALEELELALELNPNATPAHFIYGVAWAWAGNPRKAFEVYESHLESNPRIAMRGAFEANMGYALFELGDLQGCLDMISRGLRMLGKTLSHPYLYAAACHQISGRPNDAKEAVKTALKISPALSLQRTNDVMRNYLGPQKAKFLQALVDAGLPE